MSSPHMKTMSSAKQARFSCRISKLFHSTAGLNQDQLSFFLDTRWNMTFDLPELDEDQSFTTDGHFTSDHNSNQLSSLPCDCESPDTVICRCQRSEDFTAFLNNSLPSTPASKITASHLSLASTSSSSDILPSLSSPSTPLSLSSCSSRDYVSAKSDGCPTPASAKNSPTNHISTQPGSYYKLKPPPVNPPTYSVWPSVPTPSTPTKTNVRRRTPSKLSIPGLPVILDDEYDFQSEALKYDQAIALNFSRPRLSPRVVPQRSPRSPRPTT